MAHAAKSGVEHALALRIYTTRLLGRDPKLALHGGGNTSLKTHAVDHLGEKVEVLRVKGSGADMAAIEAEDLPAVRLDALRRLRALEAIGDDELLAIERVNLIDPAAPNPSVEIMLHAFLPHKFVDHTHATALLSLIDQPDGPVRRDRPHGKVLLRPPGMPPAPAYQPAREHHEAQHRRPAEHAKTGPGELPPARLHKADPQREPGRGEDRVGED